MAMFDMDVIGKSPSDLSILVVLVPEGYWSWSTLGKSVQCSD